MLNVRRWVQVLHGSRFLVEEDWRERLSKIGIAAESDWTTLEGDELVSSSPATKCYRMPLSDGEVVYFKRYVYPRKKWMEFWMRAGKAAVEVFAYGRLKQFDIPTLEVLAFGEKRRFGMLLETFIVTREVRGAVDLKSFAVNTWYGMRQDEKVRVYKEITGHLVNQLRIAHKAHFFHHDLKFRNILIQKTGENYVPVWIDAPRADIKRLRHRRGVVVELSGLARVALSLTSVYDRMRFVCRYLGPERRPGEARRLYLQVSRHLARRPPRPLELSKGK